METSNRKGLLTVSSIAVPLAPSVDQQYLGVERPFMVMREGICVMVIVGTDGTPREVAIVAAVVERRSTCRCSDDRQIGLVLGPRRGSANEPHPDEDSELTPPYGTTRQTAPLPRIPSVSAIPPGAVDAQFLRHGLARSARERLGPKHALQFRARAS